MEKRKKSTSIRRRILFPMLLLIFLQISLFLSTMYLGGLTRQLNQNAFDILNERVINRGSYLETDMINSWSNVGLMVEQMNQTTARMLEDGAITLSGLDNDSRSYLPLLMESANGLVSMMRTNLVTGAFVILNTHDLNADIAAGQLKNKPGIYLRDLDPVSEASVNNGDLLIERASSEVVRKLGITTDSSWRPQFEFTVQGKEYYNFLLKPYQQALLNPDLSYSDLGYWSRPYTLYEDNRSAISYSVPLKLTDGTVYGVLGVEITLDYLSKVLPYDEISEGKTGSYVLAVGQEDSLNFENVLISGPIYGQANGSSSMTTLKQQRENGYLVELDDGEWSPMYGCVRYLNLYNTNTPFSGSRWALIGIERGKDLFAFSHNIQFVLYIAVFVAICIGVLGIFLVSYIISKPVISLVKNVQESSPDKPATLRRTNIREMDELASSIERLSQDVYDSAAKFTEILEMASIRIGGFEIDLQKQSLFLTEGFFKVFNREEIDPKALNLKGFQAELEKFKPYIQEYNHEEALYRIPVHRNFIWVRLRYITAGSRWVGLAEDVTKATLELQKIEHERDYDLLTNLINRRAFHRIMQKLFHMEPQRLRTAALVMLDLDNLKYINDTYGHDYGDEYIRCAADTLMKSAPQGTVVSRVSGDEFLVFLYGYEDKEEIRRHISRLKYGLYHKIMNLPDGQPYRIRASGGIAWYPDDSRDYEQLIRYADFAMYKVKNSIKGELIDFDIGDYNNESYLLQSKEELNTLIDRHLVDYHFQPIVDAQNGTVFAYEALMRSKLAALRSPTEILALAKKESKLNKIEILTWFRAMAAFTEHIQTGRVPDSCRVFINSISNQLLSEEDSRRFASMYGDYLHLIVEEVTEEEKLNEEVQRIKKQRIALWKGEIALDDYGSGYNGESILLNLSPKFVKIDMSIIRDIDSDKNKQKLVENLLSYAHERGMLLIAEGVETYAEMEILVRMGVDYLQGYYLGMPSLYPAVPEPEIVEQIVKLNHNRS